jgi:hypothetical protein
MADTNLFALLQDEEENADPEVIAGKAAVAKPAPKAAPAASKGESAVIATLAWRCNMPVKLAMFAFCMRSTLSRYTGACLDF